MNGSISAATAFTLNDAFAAVEPHASPRDYEEVPVDVEQIELLTSYSGVKAWPLTIRTPDAPWSYAAYLPIPPRVRKVGNALLRIRTTAVNGEPWVGVLTRDQRAFIHRVAIPHGTGARETLLGAFDLRTASRIVIENGGLDESSAATIESVSLLVPAASDDLIPVYADSVEILSNEALTELTRAQPSRESSLLPSRAVRLGRHRFVVHGLSEADVYFESIQDNFEPEFQAFCEQFVEQDAICIDIGANIGMKTLFLSQHAHKGRVVAVEAAPSVARCLEMNVAANRASNVDILQAAVGDRIGTVHFTEGSAYGHLSSEGVEVPMITLDEIVRRLELPRVDFVKIDVEGFEYPILKSAYDLINRHRALVLLEFNSWCQLAFADVNPKEFLSWIFEHFAHVAILRNSPKGYDLIEGVQKEQLLYVLHDNLVAHGCVTDLVVTNAIERL